MYSSLHLLAVMGEKKIVAIQFIRETSNSELIFAFLRIVFDRIYRLHGQSQTNKVFMYDNSPLNKSLELFNLAARKKIVRLFTELNSSFLNLIEMILAKLKSPLKLTTCLNKYFNK